MKELTKAASAYLWTQTTIDILRLIAGLGILAWLVVTISQ